MRIDRLCYTIELAHAVGLVLGGTPLGDLDLVPNPMRVEDDEGLYGAVRRYS